MRTSGLWIHLNFYYLSFILFLISLKLIKLNLLCYRLLPSLKYQFNHLISFDRVLAIDIRSILGLRLLHIRIINLIALLLGETILIRSFIIKIPMSLLICRLFSNPFQFYLLMIFHFIIFQNLLLFILA